VLSQIKPDKERKHPLFGESWIFSKTVLRKELDEEGNY
jgi:hypothetical protein